MNSGVVSSIFSFPPSRLRWDTHSLIYYDTYRALVARQPEFEKFIKLKEIFKYDGAYGPDRLWMKGERATSESYYNPMNGQGGALKQIIRHYSEAKERMINNLPWAKDFTWMSHFVVDVLSPSHHFGHKIKPRKKYRDWEDPYFHRINPASLRNRHMIFEAMINGWQIFGRRFKPKFEELEKIRGEEVSEFIRKTVDKVRALGLYEEFLERGFNRRLWHRVNEELIPKIDYALGVVWWCLMRETAEGKRDDKKLNI